MISKVPCNYCYYNSASVTAHSHSHSHREIRKVSAGQRASHHFEASKTESALNVINTRIQKPSSDPGQSRHLNIERRKMQAASARTLFAGWQSYLFTDRAWKMVGDFFEPYLVQKAQG